MMNELFASSLFSGRELIADAVLTHDAGLITSIVSAAPRPGARRFVIPALVNAHDHARPTASSFGVVNSPLESWILRSVLGTPPEPYLVAAASLARSARAGCGAMMVHYTRPSGTLSMLDEARAIGRAATDVGIRIGFALAVRDRNPLVYGDGAQLLADLTPAMHRTVAALFLKPPMTPRAYLDLTEEIAAAIGGPTIDVQFGPAGVQWCSRALLEAIAEASALTGRRVHMHLLETIYQRRWADREFPDGVVAYLNGIGLLSERLTLAHCTHATPEELSLIGASGARIITNFSSNLHLRSGLAPIAEAHRRGCAIAVGVDGLALDEDDDALREMRLVKLAHGGLGYQSTWTAAEFFGLAIRNGRAATGAPGLGELMAGAPADFTVLDLDRLDRDAILPVNPLDLLFARGNAALVREVVVAGTTIVRDGAPTGVDLPAIEAELRDRFRDSVARYAEFQAGWPALDQALSGWFHNHCGCG